MSDHSTHNEGHGHHDDHGSDNATVNPTQFEIPIVLGGLIWVLVFMFLNICSCNKECCEDGKGTCEKTEMPAGGEHH
ncbi:MAG: hypothetical protein IAF38_19840 [Bacteroidia bacterium]|nr:hypothetical protein [Bacteroidia bacterium]